MTEPNSAVKALCRNCDEPLSLVSCGCWVDSTGSRWCYSGKSLHEPEEHVQPERCRG